MCSNVVIISEWIGDYNVPWLNYMLTVSPFCTTPLKADVHVCYSLIVNRWPVCKPVNRIINRSAWFKTGWGRAESDSGSISQPAWLESGSRSRLARSESGPARTLDGLYYNSTKALDGGQQSWLIAEATRYNQHGATSAVSRRNVSRRWHT